jgi:hypothetical protein
MRICDLASQFGSIGILHIEGPKYGEAHEVSSRVNNEAGTVPRLVDVQMPNHIPQFLAQKICHVLQYLRDFRLILIGI